MTTFCSYESCVCLLVFLFLTLVYLVGIIKLQSNIRNHGVCILTNIQNLVYEMNHRIAAWDVQLHDGGTLYSFMIIKPKVLKKHKYHFYMPSNLHGLKFYLYQ